MSSEVPAQPLGRPECGQRIDVTAARQLEHPAGVVNSHPRCGIGFGCDSALGSPDPSLCLFELPLPGQYCSEDLVGGAGGRLVGPAVPACQLDRLPAALRRRRRRFEDLDHCQVGQAAEFKKRQPDPVRHRLALLQVPRCLIEPGCPYLGDAEADQRQPAQLLAEAEPPRVLGLGHCPQPPRLLNRGREVAALLGDPEPHDGHQDLVVRPTVCRYSCRSRAGARDVPLRRPQRSHGQLVSRHDGGEFHIVGSRASRESGQQLVRGEALTMEIETEPAVGDKAGGQGPVARCLGVADRLDGVLVLGVPAGGRGVQRRDLARCGAPEFQLQQVGEQAVVPEPGPRSVHRCHERVRLFQLVQDLLPAAAPGQGIGERAVDPIQHAGPQQEPPHFRVLTRQHLRKQVLRDRPLGARELFRESFRIGVPGQRQRRQPQPGRPAFGPLIKQRQR